MRIDLKKHALVGAATAAATLVLLFVGHYFGPIPAMILGSVLVGIGYEVLQWYTGIGEPDPKDAIATAAGGVVLTIVAWALKSLYIYLSK